VVEPHAAPCCPGSRRWVFDPDVIEVAGQKYIFYGSYFGGISARTLTPDGLHSNPASQVQITIDNRYEGTNIVSFGGYYYLFVSATDCCRGPLTGYSVFAGRSPNILGPYVDREGVSLLDGRVGGTPVISMNGNKWVGPGHNAVFEDFDGQWWTVYHAVNRFDPYFEGAVGFTKRPVLMDALDWIGGWPTVRGGQWASDSRQPAPAAQPGDRTNYRVRTPQPDVPGREDTRLSDEFNGTALGGQWTWVRQPPTGTYGLTGATFRFDTQAADLYQDTNNASVLTEDAPRGEYIVETKLNLNVPPEGCCFNYVQAGLVIYGDDDNFIKLAHVSIWDTRQTEFAKELFPVPQGYPRYGNTVVGPPGDWTYLRIVKETERREEEYRAYTSRDGTNWVRGGVWTHNLGRDARIGLVSMGGSGFVANFDYVRVYRLRH
jgi:arabinan endo-1,5-alpha-L-arabinosidase